MFELRETRNLEFNFDYAEEADSNPMNNDATNFESASKEAIWRWASGDNDGEKVTILVYLSLFSLIRKRAQRTIKLARTCILHIARFRYVCLNVMLLFYSSEEKVHQFYIYMGMCVCVYGNHCLLYELLSLLPSILILGIFRIHVRLLIECSRFLLLYSFPETQYFVFLGK